MAPVMSSQVLAQRCHWWLKLSGAVPAQVPVVAVSVRPSRAVPLITGTVLFAGGSAATAAVCVERAVLEPAVLVAVTETRTVDPTSAGPSLYDWPIAPEM